MHYTTLVLVLVAVFNLLDRQILAVLIEPIKHDLQLSDTAMGVLTGFAFVAFYTLASVPIARLADSANRRTIIAVALAFWSVMTAVSSLAELVRSAPRSHASVLVSANRPPHRRVTRCSRTCIRLGVVRSRSR